MCLGMNPAARVKPTPRGEILGTWLFWLMILILIITLLQFISAPSSGLYSLMLCIIGLCAVDRCPCNCNNLSNRFAQPQQMQQPQIQGPVYNIEQLLCVVFFSGYLWVITLVYLILFLAELDKKNYGNATISVVLIAYFGGLIGYGASLYISKQLYDELRLNYSPVTALANQGQLGMGGPGMGQPGVYNNPRLQQYQTGDNNNNNTGVGNIGPSSTGNTRGYTAYQGKGYSLKD